MSAFISSNCFSQPSRQLYDASWVRLTSAFSFFFFFLSVVWILTRPSQPGEHQNYRAPSLHSNPPRPLPYSLPLQMYRYADMTEYFQPHCMPPPSAPPVRTFLDKGRQLASASHVPPHPLLRARHPSRFCSRSRSPVQRRSRSRSRSPVRRRSRSRSRSPRRGHTRYICARWLLGRVCKGTVRFSCLISLRNWCSQNGNRSSGSSAAGCTA